MWGDPEKAQQLMQERTRLEQGLTTYRELDQELEDNIQLIAMAEEEGDDETLHDAEQGIGTIAERLAQMKIESLLSGEADGNNAFIEIHPGAGGTESQDWASILLRMYMRWGEQRGFRPQLIEESAGEEAGIKSATIKLSGHNAYGWAKTESGVHRLVRISPFDSNARRHTSFASIWVYPEVDDNIDIEINESDLHIDTYRASGAGGQHVNTTDSAVRITHAPTGIVVQCQNERSQHKNRATAMSMLRARLYERELQIREDAASAEQSSKTDIGWGHQIRSYVLHPYQMVKDLRTNVETSDSQGVLDGNLDPFISAALAERIQGKANETPVDAA